ncbi:MAG: hypothetical protein OEW87_10640 [Flavobacteriaceae bacterium]|nr:hypothetical protein [Flavobacteriaceae bacterium]
MTAGEPNIHHIYPLFEKHHFDKSEALDVVNLFLAITAKDRNKINALNSRIEYFKLQTQIADSLQMELNTAIQKWSDKVRRLGGIPIELFKVKIPTDGGFYLWEFPHANIDFIPEISH